MFLETSALTGENVEETFLKCARQILTKIESGMYCFCRNTGPVVQSIISLTSLLVVKM